MSLNKLAESFNHSDNHEIKTKHPQYNKIPHCKTNILLAIQFRGPL